MKLILPSFFVIVGMGFVFLNLEERALDAYNFYHGVRLASPLDSPAQRFIGVKAIKNNAVYLAKGGLRTVLKVEPLNFRLLEESQRKAIILNYREFLNHLTTPIQVIVKTSKPDLKDYYERAQERLKGSSKEMHSLFEDFMVFEDDFLDKNCVMERNFYLVVSPQARSLLGKAGSKDDRELKELEEKTKIIQEKLLACGLQSRRLENAGLKQFFSTYSSQEADSSEERKDEKGAKSKKRPKKAAKKGSRAKT